MGVTGDFSYGIFMKNTILHIGVGKAGSSSIQNFMEKNRKLLAENGVIYPYDLIQGTRLGGDNQKCLAMGCVPYSPQNIVFKQQKVFSTIQKNAFDKKVEDIYVKQLSEISDSSLVVLSAEHFWSELKDRESITLLKNKLIRLGLKVIKVVVYLREQSDWYNSFICQKIREGTNTQLSNSIDYKYIYNRLNYKKSLDLWSDVFGKSTITPLIFEHAAFYKKDLILDFFNSFNMIDTLDSIADLDFSSKIANPSSLSIESYRFLALSNKFKDSHALQSKMSDLKINILNRLSEIEHSDKGKSLLSSEQEKNIRALFKEGNKDIAQEYFSREALFSIKYTTDNSIPIQTMNTKSFYEFVCLNLIN